MTTSNSFDFLLTRDNLLSLAHQHIGALGEGETLTSSQATESALLLNMIAKLRASMGMPIWALKRGYVLPVTGVSSVATDSHVVSTYDTTTLSAAAAVSATSLTVTSITGFTNADQIGIELTNGDVQWTTINGVPSGTTIVITTGLTSAAASGNRIYGYTASSERVSKPLRITQADRLDVGGATSVEIKRYSRYDYFNVTSRTTEGPPIGIFYDWGSTLNTNLDNGSIFVWPRFSDGKSVIEFTYQRQFQDFDASSDNPDFPQAFYLPLMLELAALLGPKFGVPIDERKSLFGEAEKYFQLALDTIGPEESLQFGLSDVGRV